MAKEWNRKNFGRIIQVGSKGPGSFEITKKVPTSFYMDWQSESFDVGFRPSHQRMKKKETIERSVRLAPNSPNGAGLLFLLPLGFLVIIFACIR